MAGRVREWLDERLGWKALAVRLLDGRVELKGAWLRTSGVTCLVLVLVECVSGAALAQFYTPSTAAAYKDIQAMQQDHLGRLIRGVHHWGSAALIVLALFAIARMFFGGEYKRKFDVVWIAALLFSQIVLLFQLTGHLLPWDTNAVATANVEGGFVGNLWGIGPFLKRLILGGSVAGASTLTRWYSLHVTVLPLLLVFLVGLPLFAYRLHQGASGSVGPHRSDGPPRERFYPNHMAREMLIALGVFVLVLVLAVSRGAPLELEATAANLENDYQALAEWYVLPMHALTLIPPFNRVEVEPIATVVLPGGLFLILLALPFIDRNPSRRFAKRPFAAAAGVVVIGGTILLYGYAYIRERPLATKQNERIATAKCERAPVVDANLAVKGKELYDKLTPACNTCHAIIGKGGTTGPDLTHAGTLHPDRDWQIEHLIRPESRVPGSTMPAYGSIAKPYEIRALAEYMLSLR